MTSKEFDRWIRKSVEDIPSGSSAGDWERFESRLDSELTDSEFDQKIKEKLVDSRASYAPYRWTEFLHFSAFRKLFRVDLIYNKLFEATLLGLVILLFLPSLPSNQPIMEYTQSVAYLSAVDQDKTHMGSTSEAQLNIRDNHPPNLLPPDNIASREDISGTAGEVQAISEFKMDSGSEITTEYTQVLRSSLPAFNREASSLLPLISLHLSDSNLKDVYANGTPKLLKVELTPLETYYPVQWISKVSQPSPLLAVISPEEQSKSNYQTILSTFATVDINTIHTPFDQVYHRSGYEQSKAGFGGGIAIGFQQDRWTFETGMIFSMKQYSPKNVLEIFRFSSSEESAQAISLNSIELNTLHIPVNLRYDLIESSGKWMPFVKLGVGLNLATHANYQREEIIFAMNFTPPVQTDITMDNEPRMNQKRFTDGIFQGGSFEENYYISLNAGVGVDYSLSDQWRLFSQLGYSFNALEKKLGPNEDHINTISLQMGVRHLPVR